MTGGSAGEPAGADMLAGRLAVVTGASRGIGLAVAQRLGARGARVVMLARGLDVLAARAREVGHRAVALRCDLADRGSVAEAAARIAGEHGVPDVVVNNAGLFAISPVAETSVDDFAATVETNLVAPFALVRAFLPAMRARGDGHIVTVGSVADRNAFPGNGAYAASKYGARALHEVMRLELRGSGVRATLVSPGPTDTPLWDPIDPDSREGFTPRAAMLSADAVGDAVLWAVTRDASVNIDELRLSRA